VRSSYAPVNGLRMYYEIHGSPNGKSLPLVLLHGDGSTIETSFGKVLESVAPQRLVLTWVRPFEADSESKHSSLTFDIEPQGTVVCLTVTHEDREADSEMHKGIVA
jgi:uncharacterized protein YndB with AHSA1/START domain